MEVLGSYDPHLKKGIFKAERIKYWMEKGAQVSDSVWNLLIRNNIISGAKRAVKMKKKPVEAEKESTGGKPAEAKSEVNPLAGGEEKTEAKEETKKEEKEEEVNPPAGGEEKPVEASIEASKEEAK